MEQFQAFGHAESNWTRWQTAEEEYTVQYTTFDGVWPSEVRSLMAVFVTYITCTV